jgi:hypothetical protein
LTGLTENLSAELTPAFTGGTYAYTLAAAHTEDSVNLTAVCDGATFVYTYGGSSHASGEYIPLTTGQNVITVTVSKTGCTDAVYTVTVTRAEPLSSVAVVTSGVYTVDNDADTITGVPYNTAKAAFLANLSKGQADQTWNGTGIADPVVTGNKLVVTAQDGTANVTYTITVNAAPGGGGGNGGGYVPPVVQEPEPEPEPEEELPAGATDVSGSIDTEGHFTEAVTIAAENTTVVLEIGQGTIGLDADEHPLGEITVVPLAEPPADPPAGTVALVYDFGPDGATFEPAIRMSIPLPEGIDPANTSIAYWNGNEWEVLETEYDPATGRLTAFTNHFSIFAVLVLEPEVTAEEPVIEPADEPEPVVSEPAPGPIIDDMPESEAPASQESSLDVAGKAGNGFAWYWWLIIAVACVVIGTTVYLDRKQRKARE